MKKGLRHFRHDNLQKKVGQNRRPDEEGIKTSNRRKYFLSNRQNRRPDEEGIKTRQMYGIQQQPVRTVDLMKKGLRRKYAPTRHAQHRSEP